ncbi:MAG: molybdenum ABC transporter ATP-binding protein [Methylococcales bacterium]|nr:molybdenum ABC transporter ATP-binding protein [Methylococcales bacterium]
MLSLDIQLQRGNFDLEAKFSLDKPVTGLFGSSGSGKSTLLNLVAGLAHPDNGWLKLGEKHLFNSAKNINLSPNKREVGVVFQDSQLFPHLPVTQNLLYGYKRIHRKQRRFEMPEIVDLLEIGHLLKKRPAQLSGGEKQRVGLGRALLASPRFLMLDEPLASLDQGLKQQILPFLKRVKDELNLPMVYISHSMEEILHLTDYLVVINNGRILGDGHFYDVIKEERVQGIANTMGLENIITATIIDHDIESGHTIAELKGNRILLPLTDKFSIGDSCYLSIRSSEIAIAKQHISQISIQNQIKAPIISCTKNASCISICVDIGAAPLTIDITPKAFSDLSLCQGDQVYCLIKAQSFSFLGKAG